MSEEPSDETAQVARIFTNLGADSEQSQVMAAQLLKRAGQIATERGISKVEATESLLKQVVAARQGG